MVYPMGIMSGLGSPFASSIRKIAQPIDNGYRGPTQMGPQGVLGGPIPRGGYESVAENKATPDLTSLLSGLGGLIPENRLGEVVTAPTRSRLRYDPNTITTDRFGRRVASAVRNDGTIDESNSIYVDAEDKRVQDDFDRQMAVFNEQQEALGEGFTRGQLRDYLAQQRLQGMKDKFTNIEQGFFNSPEFAEYLQAGKGVGTMDVRFSPYFGRQSSGSIGGAQDTAYEKYLNRTGLTDYLQGGQNFKQAEDYVQPSIGILKDASGMPDTRGPNVPGNRPPNPNNSLIDPYARPMPGMLPQPIEINPNYRPNLPYRPNPNLPFNGNPNMYQRPMRRPFGFGGRPMNPFMGMGIGMMNPMGMGMFGGFPMRPPMFGGYGGYGGGYGGYGGGYNMMRPPMGFGLGGANPYGMNPYSNFGRPNPYPQPSYNMPSPYSSGMSFNQPNFMQQQQGGYGSYQQPSGYGNYGGMQNPYQPQQMGNTNNFAGYGQQQAMF